MKKVLKTLTQLLFTYLIFAFYEWNINPGEWVVYSRIGAVIVFALIATVTHEEK